MNYVLTNEGLDVLEKKELIEILNSCFKDLDDPRLDKLPYEDDVREYEAEKKISGLWEKIEKDESEYIMHNESFIIHSGIIPDLLKDKLPKNLNHEIKQAISAYYLYWDRFLKNTGFNRSGYFWRDNNFLNSIEGDMHGDMKILQYDISQDKEPKLFDVKDLIKKANFSLVDGFYPEWIRTLGDFITFCIQIGKPIPFQNNWEEEFYNGNFIETKPGEVASYLIEQLKDAKENKEYSHIEVMPFVDNPLKHINPDKKVYYSNYIKSDGGFICRPFIDKDSLVYLSFTEDNQGIEFLNQKWGNPGVRFNYEQICHAIRGVVSCIQNGSSRCSPNDPGLVFKYFPYERFDGVSLI